MAHVGTQGYRLSYIKSCTCIQRNWAVYICGPNEDTQRVEWKRHLLRTASWALPSGDLADSIAPQAGESYFTCLSLKSQAVEKKRRDQREDPPGHQGVRKEERKGQGVGD